jgi:Zn-dependent peptidase ImmA (M78 family)
VHELLHFATQNGVQVHATHLPEGILGEWDEQAHRIWFDIRLTPAEQRSVIAHELGHWYYGHTCSTGRNERQADCFAAALLINPDEYARIEQISDDVEYIADELQVTEEVISDYRRYCLKRIGPLVYARRMRDLEHRFA